MQHPECPLGAKSAHLRGQKNTKNIQNSNKNRVVIFATRGLQKSQPAGGENRNPRVAKIATRGCYTRGFQKSPPAGFKNHHPRVSKITTRGFQKSPPAGGKNHHPISDYY
jgi:hypothetical protein